MWMTHREPPVRIHLNHAAQQTLAVRRHKVRYVKDAALDFLQQLAQVVVVEGQRTHQQGVQDDPAGPDIRLAAIVLLTLEKCENINGKMGNQKLKHFQDERLSVCLGIPSVFAFSLIIFEIRLAIVRGPKSLGPFTLFLLNHIRMGMPSGRSECLLI